MRILKYILKIVCISGAFLLGSTALSNGAVSSTFEAPGTSDLDLSIENNCNEGFYLDEGVSGFYQDLNENLPRYIGPNSLNASYVSTNFNSFLLSPASSYGSVTYRMEGNLDNWFKVNFLEPDHAGAKRINIESSRVVAVTQDEQLPGIGIKSNPINTQVWCN